MSYACVLMGKAVSGIAIAIYVCVIYSLSTVVNWRSIIFLFGGSSPVLEGSTGGFFILNISMNHIIDAPVALMIKIYFK